MQKINVLWLGLEQFTFPLNETSSDKYNRLSKYFNCHVTSVSSKNKFEHVFSNNTHFYLIPKIGKLVYVFLIYIFLLLTITPFIIFKKRINVLIASDPFIPGLILAFWKRVLFFKKLSLITEAFGNWVETPAAPLPKLLRWPTRLIIEVISKFSISSADALRAESLVTLKKLQSYTKKSLLSDQFNLMHMELFDNINIKKTLHKNEFHILFIGRVVKLKGVQFIIDIINEIKHDFPEIKLLVGGNGDYLPNLKKQVSNLKLEKYVKFLGNLSRQEVKQQLANCDLFILPSMSEGRPRVLIEAMVMQKPMIATNVGAISELIIDGKNGFLFNPYDLKTLKEKIIWILKHKSYVKNQMGIKANRSLIKGFGDRFTMKGYEKLYSNLIKKVYELKHQST